MQVVLLPIALLLGGSVQSLGCTTFCLEQEGRPVFGRNLDWMAEDGLVIVNKRGIAKTAFVAENPARWVSRFGSITFNQYGRELPMGGMNEAGLVVENMWLDAAEYPEADFRPTVSELQWIQYQLDTAADAAEVIASGSAVRISKQNAAPIHFLVADRKGSCASIEFLEGRMIVHTGDSIPVMVLANSTYEESLAFLDAVGGDEEGDAFRRGSDSLRRFYQAARAIRDGKTIGSEQAIEYAFGILERVSVDRTQWRIVYDIASGLIHFRTRSDPSVRVIDLNRFDFACGTPVTLLVMSHPGPGNVESAFVPYSLETNYEQIRKAFGLTGFLQGVPDSILAGLARYPEALPCME